MPRVTQVAVAAAIIKAFIKQRVFYCVITMEFYPRRFMLSLHGMAFNVLKLQECILSNSKFVNPLTRDKLTHDDLVDIDAKVAAVGCTPQCVAHFRHLDTIFKALYMYKVYRSVTLDGRTFTHPFSVHDVDDRFSYMFCVRIGQTAARLCAQVKQQCSVVTQEMVTIALRDMAAMWRNLRVHGVIRPSLDLALTLFREVCGVNVTAEDTSTSFIRLKCTLMSVFETMEPNFVEEFCVNNLQSYTLA